MGFSGCEQTVGRCGHTDPTSANTVTAFTGRFLQAQCCVGTLGTETTVALSPQRWHMCPFLDCQDACVHTEVLHLLLG